MTEETAGIGHNSQDGKERFDSTAGARIRSIIERVERLNEEKAALAEDIKDVYGEAKATGFDTKTLRKLVRLRKMEPEKRREEADLEEIYKAAIGME